jgi:hypothetical protein
MSDITDIDFAVEEVDAALNNQHFHDVSMMLDHAMISSPVNYFDSDDGVDSYENDDTTAPQPPRLLSAMVAAEAAKVGNDSAESGGTLFSSLSGDRSRVRRTTLTASETTTTASSKDPSRAVSDSNPEPKDEYLTPEPPQPLALPPFLPAVPMSSPPTTAMMTLNQHSNPPSETRQSMALDSIFQKPRWSLFGSDEEYGMSDIMGSPFDTSRITGTAEHSGSDRTHPYPAIKKPSKLLERMKQGMAITRDDGALITDYYDTTAGGRSRPTSVTSENDEQCMRRALYVIGVVIVLLVITVVILVLVLVVQEKNSRNAAA